MTELEGLPEVVTAVLTPLPGERRSSVRIKPSKPECGRSKSRYGHVQELQTTVNISSGGLYFITSLEHYYKGMKLMVTSPFPPEVTIDRKSTRLNSSHGSISYAVFCLKKKNNKRKKNQQCKKR